MILGLDRHPAAQCFLELDDAITALRPAGARPVVLNAHAFPDEIPADAIVYNLENVGIQVSPDAFAGRDVWDFSLRNIARWKRPVRHVPVGFHPSMARFAMRPWQERDIDVVLTGCLNERRARVLVALAELGLSVAHIGPGQAYGMKRNDVLARSKLALNILFHEDGVHPVLRSAHCAANGLPMLAEEAHETPPWVRATCKYNDLVDTTVRMLERQQGRSDRPRFQRHPMQLPEES